MAEAAHAQLGHAESGRKAARDGAAGIDDARAVRERVHGDSQFGGPIDILIRQSAGAFVHSQVSHVEPHMIAHLRPRRAISRRGVANRVSG